MTSLSPSYAIPGGASFTPHRAGTNFVSGAKVRWNGANRTTTFVSATQLRASITAADIATPGTIPVTVLNPDAGLSNGVNFEVQPPAAAYTDDFNRPNESPLKGSWAAWDFGLGSLELYNNQVRSTGYILTLLNSSAAIWVRYGTSGTWQQVGTDFNGTFAAGDVCKLAISGNILTVYRNRVSLGTRTDTNNRVPSGGSPGMSIVAGGNAVPGPNRRKLSCRCDTATRRWLSP